MIVNDFYVYMYLDSQSIPFYIGRGRGRRWEIAGHLRRDRNTFLMRKILKIDPTNILVRFLHKDIGFEESCTWERYWIQYIGRRYLNEGSLCNIGEGGEFATTGYKLTEEHKRKVSRARTGRKLTEQTKQKISKTLTGKKRPQEVIQKMKMALTGRKQTEQHKRKVSTAIKLWWDNKRRVA